LLQRNIVRPCHDKAKNFHNHPHDISEQAPDRAWFRDILGRLGRAGYQNWAMRTMPRFARLDPDPRENHHVIADFSFEDGGYLIEVYASEVEPGQWKVRSVFQRLSDLDDEQGIAAVIQHESDVIFESMPHAMLAGREQAKQLVRSGSVVL
jgi:Zn-dependent protease with chaperone function